MAKTNKKPSPYYHMGPSGVRAARGVEGGRVVETYANLGRGCLQAVVLYLAGMLMWIVFVLPEDTPRERLRQQMRW